MDRVDEMREFVNRLAAEHSIRTDSLDELTLGVQTSLQTFSADRQAMAEQMQAALDAARSEREDAVATIRTQAQAFVSDAGAARKSMADDLFGMLGMVHDQRVATVSDMLNGFAAGRQEMAEAQQAALAQARAERQDAVAQMQTNTRATMTQVSVERSVMGVELRDSLAQNKAERVNEVAGMIAEIEAMLARMSAENQAAAEELRAFLMSDRETRSQVVADMMDGIASDRKAMAAALAERLENFTAALQADVTGTLAGFAVDRAELHDSLVEMSQIWQEFAAAMRGQPKPAAKPVTSKAAKPKAAKPKAEKPKAAKPKAAPAKAEKTAVAPPAPDDEEVNLAILAFLADHPDGVKLVDMEPVFGLARPVLGRHLRSLVDAGKVMKNPDTLVYQLS